MLSEPDKRLSIRKSLKKTICFEILLVESGEHKKFLYDGRCVDISEDGLGLITDYYFKKGDVLKLLVPFDCVNSPNISIPIFAEVVWSKRESDGRFTNGLRFLKAQK